MLLLLASFTAIAFMSAAFMGTSYGEASLENVA